MHETPMILCQVYGLVSIYLILYFLLPLDFYLLGMPSTFFYFLHY